MPMELFWSSETESGRASCNDAIDRHRAVRKKACNVLTRKMILSFSCILLLFLFFAMSVTETFHGYIETTRDSLVVFEACRRGLLPRVSRRLQEKERQLVRSGAVFCFDENESGKRTRQRPLSLLLSTLFVVLTNRYQAMDGWFGMESISDTGQLFGIP